MVVVLVLLLVFCVGLRAAVVTALGRSLASGWTIFFGSGRYRDVIASVLDSLEYKCNEMGGTLDDDDN